MATNVNVFGNPITDETLKGMPEYADKEVITRADRARVAMEMKDAENKGAKAREYVEKMQTERVMGGGTMLCLVYNATGDRVTYVRFHDYRGNVGSPFAVSIENGQWSWFLHHNTSGDGTGSSAAVVYRGQNEDGVACDWMMAWSNSSSSDPNSVNKVYTEVRHATHYDPDSSSWDPTWVPHWDYIYNLMEKSGGATYRDEWNKCISLMATERTATYPILDGIMALKRA